MLDNVGEGKTNSYVTFFYRHTSVGRHGYASVGRLTGTYQHQLCTNIDIVWRTSRERWMIGTNGERESGKSLLAVRHDDDDDDMHKKMHL